MSQSPSGTGTARRGLRALLDPGPSGRLAGDKIQRGVLVVAIVLLVAMVVVAVLLGLTTHDGGAGVASFVLFTAASAVGAGLGFLFGMPRARTAGEAPVTTTTSSYYLTNSNLIKVSDWLTTIVIGLGLVNVGKAIPSIRALAHALHAPLGGAAYSGAIGISVLIIGLLAGFILDYLWTSIRVRELLEESERQEQVPELTDRTLGEARQELAGKQLTLTVPPGASDDATVIAQVPPSGTPVAPGTGVAVTMLAPGQRVPPVGETQRVPPADGAQRVPAADGAQRVPAADGAQRVPAADETQKLGS